MISYQRTWGCVPCANVVTRCILNDLLHFFLHSHISWYALFDLTGTTAEQVVLTPKVASMPAFEDVMEYVDLLTPCFPEEAGILADNVTTLRLTALAEQPRELLGASVKGTAPFAERGGCMTSSLALFRTKGHSSLASSRTKGHSSQQDPLSKILEVLPCSHPRLKRVFLSPFFFPFSW